MKRNILLCVAGTTPQIITESLYDLVIRNEKRIDEIRVITTLEGRDKIMTGFINGRGSAEESLLHPENGKFFKFLKDYPEAGEIEFKESKIALLRSRDGQNLVDIRTPAENELAGDQICEFVREICKDENYQIFASAAGGRKTMGIYLTLAMSLFGRSEDSLSHVLVDPEFETNRNFFYPPRSPEMIEVVDTLTREKKMVSTSKASIYLAPIPFIRLRGISSDNEKFGDLRNYNEMVIAAQKVLDIQEKEYDLYVNVKKKMISVGGEKVTLSTREFYFYLMFCRKHKSGYGAVSLKELDDVDFHRTLKEILFKTKSEDVDWEEIASFPKYNFAEVMLLQLRSDDPDEYVNFRDSFSVVVTRIRKAFEKAGIDKRYFLASTEDGTASYQIKLDRNRIIIE